MDLYQMFQINIFVYNSIFFFRTVAAILVCVVYISIFISPLFLRLHDFIFSFHWIWIIRLFYYYYYFTRYCMCRCSFQSYGSLCICCCLCPKAFSFYAMRNDIFQIRKNERNTQSYEENVKTKKWNKHCLRLYFSLKLVIIMCRNV